MAAMGPATRSLDALDSFRVDLNSLPPLSPSGAPSLRRRRGFSISSSAGNSSAASSPRDGPEPPEEFICPLSLDIMVDPVIVDSGQTYERSYITRWINEGNNTCPKTRQPLTGDVMYPNQILKDMIDDWCERHKVVLPVIEDENMEEAFAEVKRELAAQEASERAAAIAMESSRLQRIAMEERRNALPGWNNARYGAQAAEYSPREIRRLANTAMRRVVAARVERRNNLNNVNASASADGSLDGVGPVGEIRRESAGNGSARGGLVTGSVVGNELQGGQSLRSEDSGDYGTGFPANFDQQSKGLALAGWPGKLAMKAAIFRTQAWQMVSNEDEKENLISNAGVVAGGGAGSASFSHSGQRGGAGMGYGRSIGRQGGSGSSFKEEAKRNYAPVARGMKLSVDVERISLGAKSMEREMARAVRSISMSKESETDDDESIGFDGTTTTNDSSETTSTATSVEELQMMDLRALVESAEKGAPEDKAAAAAIILVMTRKGLGFGARVVEAGGIVPLVRLLDAEDECTVEHAVTALLNLSLIEAAAGRPENAKADVKELILEAGVLEPLVRVLSTGLLSSRTNAAAALFSLSRAGMAGRREANGERSRERGAREAIVEAGAVPELVRLLEVGNARGKKDAASTLVSLCMSRENRPIIARSGVVKTLGDLLRDGLDLIEEQAAAIFAAIVRDSEGRDVLFQEGAIAALAELVDGGSNLCREYAVSALLGLAVNSRACLLAIDEEGISASLDVLSRTGTSKTQSKASSLLEMLRSLETRSLSGRFM